jgi:hypothetical protein
MKRLRQLLLCGALIAVGFFLRDVVSFVRKLPDSGKPTLKLGGS